MLALWAAAPLIAYALSRPCRPAARCSARRTASFSRRWRSKTWHYFETFVGAEDHALPPDNVQLVPELTIAHRTSPTNIGMALLATLAAHDFGFIDTDELAGRIDATLTTVESLERFEGHLLNWYDTAHAGAAAAGLRLDGRQRQPGRRAADAVGGAAAAAQALDGTLAPRALAAAPSPCSTA